MTACEERATRACMHVDTRYVQTTARQPALYSFTHCSMKFLIAPSYNHLTQTHADLWSTALTVANPTHVHRNAVLNLTKTVQTIRIHPFNLSLPLKPVAPSTGGSRVQRTRWWDGRLVLLRNLQAEVISGLRCRVFERLIDVCAAEGGCGVVADEFGRARHR